MKYVDISLQLWKDFYVIEHELRVPITISAEKKKKIANLKRAIFNL